MKFTVLTLFPDMIMQGLNTSIIGRAVENGHISLQTINIRDYTLDKHNKVDDYPYGGGAGMLMQAQPVYAAYEATTEGRKVRTVYVTPQGIPFNQSMAQELSSEEELVFLCGHYEGIDERVLEEIVTDYVSIGDYVLTGGELPAMVMIDAISRLVPGVLNNEDSAQTESFHNDLLEYPQYSRPEVWQEKRVPEVLLSGDHRKIADWRLEQSIERTKQRRPDLYKKYMQKEKLIQKLSKKKRENIHLMESLSRGNGEILYYEGNDVLLYDRSNHLAMMTVETMETGIKLFDLIPREVELFVTAQEFMNTPVCEYFGFELFHKCYQVCYTQKQALAVKHKDIRLLGMDSFAYIAEHYEMGDTEYIRERLQAKVMYGAFEEDRLVGFVGTHGDGSMGILYVDEAYRHRGIGESLEAYNINRTCEKGWIPYAHIIVGNETSVHLQERLGLYFSDKYICWLGSSEG